MDTPKKSLGQHWLNDKDALSDIVALADLRPGDSVLEIGPGPGTLTRVLLGTGANVTAVEIDEGLADELINLDAENLLVVKADIREFNLNQLPKDYLVVANIPYYLTNYLLRLLFDAENQPSKVVLLVQKEVAERLAAGPGNMSVLSISAQVFGTVELGPVISADLFTPSPKVDSQVVVIARQERGDIADKKALFRLVKSGFSSKRKKLSNNLSAGLGVDKSEIEQTLDELRLGKNVRAQELDVNDWLKLLNSFRSVVNQAPDRDNESDTEDANVD